MRFSLTVFFPYLGLTSGFSNFQAFWSEKTPYLLLTACMQMRSRDPNPAFWLVESQIWAGSAAIWLARAQVSHPYYSEVRRLWKMSLLPHLVRKHIFNFFTCLWGKGLACPEKNSSMLCRDLQETPSPLHYHYHLQKELGGGVSKEKYTCNCRCVKFESIIQMRS